MAAGPAFAQGADPQSQPGGAGEPEPPALPGPTPGPTAEAGLPVVEPIVPDEEFDKAIPPLDAQDQAELDQPLEPIEEFEREMAEDTPDAELATPLVPLNQFDPEPVTIAAGQGDDETVTIPYTIRLSGLKEADEQTPTGLRSTFRELSALRKDGLKAANVAMVSARLEEDGELLRRILASEGWFSPRIRTQIVHGAEGSPLTAQIDVVPGKRYSLSDIVIKAPETEPPGLIRDSLPLKLGEPIVAERVQAAEAQVAVSLPHKGYPFAKVGARDILLDRRTGEGVYTLPVETGPRSRFGGFVSEGDRVFDTKHIDVLARFDRGELYDSEMVDDLRKALSATGLFANVSVEPKRSGEEAGDGTEFVNLLVKQDAGPPRTIAGSVGYGTGEGFRLEGSWTHRNLFPPEGALIVSGTAGTAEQGAGVTFRRSNAGRRDRTFELLAEARHSTFDAYSAYTGRLAAHVRHDSTPIWRKPLTYAYGVELLASGEKDYDFAKGERTRRTFYIAGLSGQLGIDHTDDLLDPTKGFRATVLIEPEGSIDGGFTPYVRARVDGSGYFPVSDDLVIAGRVRVGTIQGAGRTNIAPSRRFYAGGGGSVRGFSYQSLGPQDPDGDPIGGRSLNEASTEVRYRFGNFGVVGFVDVGQSYADHMPHFSDLRFGAGIGGRYYTNFGPLRVDIATPIDRRPHESRINIYVSIGQAF